MRSMYMPAGNLLKFNCIDLNRLRHAGYLINLIMIASAVKENGENTNDIILLDLFCFPDKLHDYYWN
jgi:hypothetical protein